MSELKIHVIEKRGDEYCVLDEAGEKTLGCHPTRAEAEAQLRAIEANKDNAQFQEGALTGETDGHRHSFSLEGARTGPPIPPSDSHTHPILKDADGALTGFGSAAGHTHEAPDEFAAHKKKKNAEKDDPPRDKLFELKGVEVFRAGKWKGDTYTTKDLDEMVANFGAVGFQPPVKLGHAENSGDPAFGWIAALRRVGDKLVADLIDLPSNLFKAIRDRRFDAVSAEIVFNMERGGKVFRRVLSAIALLGAEIPAVANLKPLRDVALDLGSHQGIHAYTMRKRQPNKEVKRMTADEILAKLPDEVKELEADLAQATEDGDDDRKSEITVTLATKRAELAEAKAEKAEADRADAEKAKDAAEKKAGMSETDALEMKKLQDELDRSNSRLATIEDERRADKIAAKVAAFNVPVLRNHIASLYELAYTASDEGRKVSYTYTADKESKTSKVDPIRVVDDLVDSINKDSAKLFKQLGMFIETENEAEIGEDK